ncbi:MAG: bifunctional DNA-formamidopyrimidine glycosylase/DNA-(apurinic or apyrimidinic site) lyase [Candidatus Paceibacterota bacterium]|jgi:formamidopyrimidine-DNA glycosylase
MPELPEVEIIVRELKQRIIGKRITGFWTDTPKIIKHPSLGAFKKLIIGAKFSDVKRIGKNILIYLKKDKRDLLLLAHQKMTGHFMVGKWSIKGVRGKGLEVRFIGRGPIATDPRNGFVRAIFYLNNGQMLALSDVRKFSKMVLGEKNKIENLSDLKKLGPDALSINFKLDEFSKKLKKTSRTIKQSLLDQSIVAGIGNIYADESLFLSKINPRNRSNQLNNVQIKNLFEAIIKVLKKAVKFRGTSIIDFRDTFGKKGGYDKVRLVYGRKGLGCKICSTPIQRIRIGQRSSHFCPKCQRSV